MDQSKRFQGSKAEDIACSYLIDQGMRLCGRNFYSRFGEIDLIMQDIDTIVFIEVRHRSSGYADALESISYTKQQKLLKAANYYLSKYANYTTPCRFDAVILDNSNKPIWLKNIIMS